MFYHFVTLRSAKNVHKKSFFVIPKNPKNMIISITIFSALRQKRSHSAISTQRNRDELWLMNDFEKVEIESVVIPKVLLSGGSGGLVG